MAAENLKVPRSERSSAQSSQLRGGESSDEKNASPARSHYISRYASGSGCARAQRRIDEDRTAQNRFIADGCRYREVTEKQWQVIEYFDCHLCEEISVTIEKEFNSTPHLRLDGRKTIDELCAEIRETTRSACVDTEQSSIRECLLFQRSHISISVQEHTGGRGLGADESEFARVDRVRKDAFAAAE